MGPGRERQVATVGVDESHSWMAIAQAGKIIYRRELLGIRVPVEEEVLAGELVERRYVGVEHALPQRWREKPLIEVPTSQLAISPVSRL